MAALVAEYKVQRQSLMEATVSRDKDIEQFAFSNIPELARMERILSIIQLYSVFPESPQVLQDCVGMCTALLEDSTSLALYRRLHVLQHPLSVCMKDIYCPVWQSLLDKWTGSLSTENLRCEGEADRPLKTFLTRMAVLWTHAVVAQILRSVMVRDANPRNPISATRRILVAEYQPDNACQPAQYTAEVELVEGDNVQWWALCLPPDLVDSVASEAPTVLQHAARLWTEEDLRCMASADHSLVSAKRESAISSKGVQQGPATARGAIIRSALSALSYYLSQSSKTLSEHPRTSPSQQANLHLVIEASHYIHARMSDYSNVFEEDSQCETLYTSLLLQAAKLCDSAADGLTRLHVTVFMSYLSHDGESNDWSNPKPFHEGERCSFPVQMFNYQLRGLFHDLEHLAPRRVAAKVACVVLSETLTFMADRYTRVKPSFARTKQFRADLVLLLSMASAMLPRLAPLEHTAAHYLSVHLERVHRACSQLLTLLVVMTSPLDLLVQALKEAAPSSGGGAGHTVKSRPSKNWISWNSGPLQQPSAYLLSTSAGSGSSGVHLVNTLTHLTRALAPSASLVLHALLYRRLSLCNMLLPAAVVTNTTASRAFILHVHAILSHAHNCPEALADAASLALKTTPDSSTPLLSDVLCHNVVGEWLCHHFTPLAVTAQLYDKAVTKLAPQYTKKEELVFLFLEDLESVVVSQGAPVLHLLSALAEKCSTDVAEVLLALSSNCCREAREALTEESGVVDAITGAPQESSLGGVVRSWRERLGRQVKEQLHSASHARGLSEEEELEAVATGIAGDLELSVKWMCHTLKANKDVLRHSLLCTDPTAQPVLLVFSEPEEACAPFNPVEEVGRVGDVHLEQGAFMGHQYDYEGALSAILCEGGWDEVMSLVQHRAEFLPDAQLEEDEVTLLEHIRSCANTM